MTDLVMDSSMRRRSCQALPISVAVSETWMLPFRQTFWSSGAGGVVVSVAALTGWCNAGCSTKAALLYCACPSKYGR
ncbi:hypothetical protein AB0A74_18410 [Saccharothrix sp. NPDC042600]|uniref:hypothetical protein n=1 Tax=Saccharothrix TaxID=2071 RepID=UPI0033EC817A